MVCWTHAESVLERRDTILRVLSIVAQAAPVSTLESTVAESLADPSAPPRVGAAGHGSVRGAAWDSCDADAEASKYEKDAYRRRAPHGPHLMPAYATP